MSQYLLEYKKNGYSIFQSIPTSALLELKETLVSIIKKSYSKNIGILKTPLNEDYVINKMFIELENKNHTFITKIYDSIRLTSSFFNVINCPNHLNYCKQLLQVDEKLELFINSMSMRMDTPGSKDFSYGWHTDADVNIGKSVFVQAWIPLVDINEKLGGLEIIENSHLKEFKTEHTDAIRKSVKNGDRLNDPLVYRTPHNTKILSQDAKKKILTANFSQTIFFSNQLMHRSGLNLTKNKVRLALTAFYHRSDLIHSDWY